MADTKFNLFESLNPKPIFDGLKKLFNVGQWKNKYLDERDNRQKELTNELQLSKEICELKIKRQAMFRYFGHVPYLSIFSILLVASQYKWFGEGLYPISDTHNFITLKFGEWGGYPVEYLGIWGICKVTNNPLTRKLYIGKGFQHLYRLPAYLITIPIWTMFNKKIKQKEDLWNERKLNSLTNQEK
ncbi:MULTISPECIES: hypothetical protein [unclassified Spiroplasma]|uniref:hypothetical protein n=1 Tax=unclassified Spiroplasma TaxID=2637901 RepID=UPI0030CC8611